MPEQTKSPPIKILWSSAVFRWWLYMIVLMGLLFAAHGAWISVGSTVSRGNDPLAVQGSLREVLPVFPILYVVVPLIVTICMWRKTIWKFFRRVVISLDDKAKNG